MKKIDNKNLFYYDSAIVVAVSILISLTANQLQLMTIAVPLLIGSRFIFFRWLSKENLKVEILFFLICTILGAFNDWNSVVNHKIYNYTVPHYFAFTTIPLWMLLIWGMILRYISSLGLLFENNRATLSGGRGSLHSSLNSPFIAKRNPQAKFFKPSSEIRFVQPRFGNAFVKVALSLVLVLGTRQFIYVWYLEPLLSWLPFALATVVYFLLFSFSKSDAKLMLAAAIVGPLIEALYIKIGGLHFYHLEVFYGVPIWIMLWWVLSAVIWKDLSLRLYKVLATLDKRNIKS